MEQEAIFDTWYSRFKHVQSNNSIYIYSKEDIKIIILVFINNITFISKDDFAITFYSLRPTIVLQTLWSRIYFLFPLNLKQDLKAYTISLSQSHC